MTVEKKSVQTTHQRVRPGLLLRGGWTIACCVPVNGFISSRDVQCVGFMRKHCAVELSVQLSRGIGIEIDRHIRMSTQEGGGALCRDQIFKRSTNYSCLATSRHGYD